MPTELGHPLMRHDALFARQLELNNERNMDMPFRQRSLATQIPAATRAIDAV